jgi:steroid delta-isomerase-like uncharacterized protein
LFESTVPTTRLTVFPKFAEKVSMAAEENKAVISTFVEEVINQGQLDRADDLVAVDFVEVDPFPGQQQGREGLKEVINAFRTAFPDIHWVIEEMVGEGDKVFSRFTWHGTHRGEFIGVPATGKQITVKGMVVDRVVAGKMAESQILMDGLSMMRQLGVIPG